MFLENKSCKDANQKEGICVKVRDCLKAFDLMNKKPVPPKTRDYLRGSQCGYVDKKVYVCCVDDDGETTEQSTASLYQDVSESKPQWLTTLEARVSNFTFCGEGASDRIFREETDLDQYPWTVLVEYKKREFKTQNDS